MSRIIEPGDCLVMGLSGPELTDAERHFLHAERPAGVILFARNIHDPDQVQGLIASIRATATPPPTLWIDQEGGRVQRLRDPLTRFPSPGRLGALEQQDPHAALELARTMGQLCGQELAVLGIGVDCAPVLDIQEAGADPVIGERAFGRSPEQVIRLAGAWLEGLAGTGVLAMGKHFPGHGAARADSHRSLPVIPRSREELERWELAPFRALAGRLPALMTAHLVASGLDPGQPATWSRAILVRLLRETWRYPGLVVSDALEMGALQGTLDQRAEGALRGGCDLLLCCTGRLDDSARTLEGVARGAAALGAEAVAAIRDRIRRGLAPHRPEPGDWRALLADGDYRRRRAVAEVLPEPARSRDPTD
ncbi:MAG: beta-N-acetylhexosaminidase, partial [Magnetococcales bacterium]|nr:beta-N-acetylhexosaminidase [Magnetococcales bacterium]